MQNRPELLRSVAQAWELDGTGQLGRRRFADLFSDSTYQMWTQMDLAYSEMVPRHGVHCVTATETTRFDAPVRAGDPVVIDGGVARLGTKSVTFEFRLKHAATGAVHAVYTIVDVFFSPATRRSEVMPDAVRRGLEPGLIAPAGPTRADPTRQSSHAEKNPNGGGKMSERLEVMRGVVHPWHQDHFGHMNVRHYAPFFDDATYHMWTKMGVPYSEMLETHGVHCVTAQATTQFIKELKAGDLIVIDGVVSRLGTKSVTFHLRMMHADTGAQHASYDIVDVFFDPRTRASTAMPAEVRARLAEWQVAV
ncbi:MAG: thioesterase family protein [Pseudomonadota bacterium]